MTRIGKKRGSVPLTEYNLTIPNLTKAGKIVIYIYFT